MKEINEYLEAIAKTREKGKALCKKLVEALKPVIPDIKCTLGWAEAGIDTICLWSSSREVSIRHGDITALLRIIEEVFPELEPHFDTPYGVYLTDEEKKKVREILLKLREEDNGA